MPQPPPSSTPPQGTPAHRYTAAYAQSLELDAQARWERDRVYEMPNPGEPGFDASRPKFYCLDMFPYPSGAGLHVGHPEGYTATDIVSRFMRMRGHNVLHPMGWDAFGLPAEQYAIQTGIHPAETTRASIDTFRRQLKRFGFSYDWSREFGTIDEGYYRWTQWIFLRLYGSWMDEQARKARPIAELEAEFAAGTRAARFNPRAEEVPESERSRGLGAWSVIDAETRRRVLDSYRLAYQSTATVNWCPKLGTVLANDEVIDGKSERGGHPVLRKPLKQWMLRITAYAERLLRQLDGLDWPASTKTMQREWIGRSEGAEIRFPIACGKHTGQDGPSLTVFTTRPDTLFGATYIVVAPEHPLVDQIMLAPADRTNAAALHAYVRAVRSRSDVERMENKEKTGVELGVEAINPGTGKPIPIWVADYVLMGYGTGAIMAVPGQDERDWEFAEVYGLPIVRTVRAPAEFTGRAYTGEGPAINSGFLDGLSIADAKRTIIAWLEEKGIGAGRVNYKLRDWTFSRQRYWGEPIPIVFDDRGRSYPVGDAHLPVKLPALADYAPVESDDPQPLLAKAKAWTRTTAGEAGVDPAQLPPGTPVTRETNTMPGSAGSSWYAIRYCDARNAERFVGKEAEAYWMGGERAGVDLYIGGSEHAVGHLLYSRFWQNVLFDLGFTACREPFRTLFHQGLITSFAFQRGDKSIVPTDEVKEVREGEYVETATGARVTPVVTKMSKRYKNVINPDDVIAEFGADTFRLYEMYMGPLDASKPWNPRDIVGCFRFLQRAWRACVHEETGGVRLAAGRDEQIERSLHRLIKKVGEDTGSLAFNTAIAAMIEFVNTVTAADSSTGGVPSGGGGGGGAASGGGVLTRDQVERFALVLAPYVPHVAEELWRRAGRATPIAHEPWPTHDPSLLQESEIEIPISVMGKVRARIMVPAAAAAEPKALESAALAHAKVQELIGGKPVKKVIAVPGKMVNLVLG